MADLEKSILWTLIYFDIFDYPLTSFEIWKYLWSPQEAVDIKQTEDELNILKTQGRIGVKDGFYFLSGREDIILERKASFQISKVKLDRARLLAKIFKHIPYLRAIFVCNRVAALTANPESDIDLFVVVQKGKIWITRFLALSFLKILGLRPSGKKRRDTFCLCFFAAEDGMNLEPYLLPPRENLPDIHYIYWLGAFLPLYDGGVISNFVQANHWVKKYLPNLELTKNSSISSFSQSKFRKICEKVGDASGVSIFFEKFLKRLQLKIMPQELKRAADLQNTNVVIKDNVLKLHLHDRREEYRNIFLKQVKIK